MVEPLPFEELFSPLVLDASDELHRQTDAALWELLSPEAHADWAQYLLSRLTAAGSKAAHWQFQVYKTVRSAFPAEGHVGEPAPNAVYRQFLGAQPRERLQKLFDEFPALAKLCAVLVKNWLTAITEFLARLHADSSELKFYFPSGNFALPVSSLQAGLGDPHRGGRCVVRLNFGSGASLIYKPRSLAPEAHFAALIDLLNTDGIPHSLRASLCWNRGSYGWMENIKARPCRAAAEVEAFYWRAGALLGLVYLARGVDFHRENMIAAGEFPVLIDLEALMHPQKPGGGGACTTSVLNTGFLPQGDPQFALYEWSALARQIRSDRSTKSWIHINQDAMNLETKRQEFLNQSHLPIFAEKIRLASESVPDLLAGFRWVGEKLLGDNENQEMFAQWLCKLIKCPRRLIVGLTVRYRLALDQITLPQSLRSEHINAEPVMECAQSSGKMVSGEIEALEQFDIPYFEQADHEVIFSDQPTFPHLSKKTYLAQMPVIAGALTRRLDA